MATASNEHVIKADESNLFGDFFDFGDDLILPDKPFGVKREKDDEFHFDKQFEDAADDFLIGATPSPSSTTSSHVLANGSVPSRTRQNSFELAMSVANELTNIDFEGAVDVDVGNFHDDLDILGDYDPVADLEMRLSTKSHTDQHTNVDAVLGSSEHCDEAFENVEVIASLNQPLKKVRSKLEKRLKVALAEYTFWLQDSHHLDDDSTLSEQCIAGNGLVKVLLNVQPVNDDGSKKIKIIDVLKADPGMSLDDSSDELSLDDDDDFFDDGVGSSTVVSPPVVEGPISNFVESVDFAQIRKRFKIPDDVSLWNKLQTFHWVKWVNRTFPGVRVNEVKWNFDGQMLLSMSEKEFPQIFGKDPENHLWTHLNILRQTGMTLVPSHFNSSQKTLNNYVNNVINKGSDVLLPSAKSAASAGSSGPSASKKPRVILGKYEEGKVFINSEDCSGAHRSGNNGCNIQLWRFLLDILTDFKHRDIIRWSAGGDCYEGEFVMIEPESVARLWGQQKGKVTMNYEKLSRALRYYKGGNILDKVHNKKFTYRFVCDLRDIVGFSASELNKRILEQAERSLAGC